MMRWDEKNEAAFVKRLEEELLKCERFQVDKVSFETHASGSKHAVWLLMNLNEL
jgi:SPX domain protein involved in polyphosphate accumulation